MKKLVLLLIAGCFSFSLWATHMAGGHLSYELVDSSKDLYRINLIIYRNSAGIALRDSIKVLVRNPYGGEKLDITLYKSNTLGLSGEGHCYKDTVNYEKTRYRSEIVHLPDLEFLDIFIISDNSIGNTEPGICCRSNDLKNVKETGGVGQVFYLRSSFRKTFPGNHSPVIINYPRLYFPEGAESHTRLQALDSDGDSLVYLLSPAFNISTYKPFNSRPFEEVPYAIGYSAQKALGQDASFEIDAETGLIYVANAEIGNYAVAFEIREYRHDTLIGQYIMEVTVSVTDTSFIDLSAGQNEDTLFTCNGDIEWPEPCSSDLFWDFTWPGNSDTSSEFIPGFRYPSPGNYTLLLVQNVHSSNPDTSFFKIRYLDSFQHNLSRDFYFKLPDTLTICKNEPYRLPGMTKGQITWCSDSGAYCVQGIRPWITLQNKANFVAIGNYLGCLFRDTVRFGTYPTDSLSITMDTSKCTEDSIRLWANGFYSYDWKPEKDISNTKLASPLIWPSITTTYTLTGKYGNGCSYQLSTEVYVHEKDPGMIEVLPGNRKCKEDTVRLKASGYVSYLWEPNEKISSTTASAPLVWPTTFTSTYTLIGIDSNGCKRKNSVRIYLHPETGRIKFSPDRNICIGDTVLISAVNYQLIRWMPDSLFSNDTAMQQILSPKEKTSFNISAIDTNGCIRNKTETVFVYHPPGEISLSSDSLTGCLNVIRKMSAASDHGRDFIWEPADWLLSGQGGKNGTIKIKGDTIFTLTVLSKWGCQRDTTFKVRISTTDSSIIGGWVRSANDFKALANVRISIVLFNPADSSLEERIQAHTTPDGRFRFKTDKKSFILRASSFHHLSILKYLPLYKENKAFWKFADSQVFHVCRKTDTMNFLLRQRAGASSNGSISGKLINTSGEILKGCILYLSDPDSGNIRYSSITDSNGLFLFTGLPIDSFALLGDWPGLENKKAPVIKLALDKYKLTGLRVRKKGKELILDGPSAIENKASDQRISLRPNPAVEYIYIETGKAEKRLYQIVDMYGIVRRSAYIQGPYSRISLNGLAPGSYLFLLHEKDGSSVIPFIKLP